MGAPKLCPHCGNDVFMAYIKRGGVVKSVGTDENGNAEFTVIREGSKENFEIELFKCTNCKNCVTEEDLIHSAICVNCGKTVAPDELDDNGNCAVCQLLIANPDVENASKEDLLRMLAQAYRTNNAAANRVQSKIEKAKAVEAKISSTETVDNSNENADVSDTADDVAKTTKRQKVRKTKTSDAVEVVQNDNPLEKSDTVVENKATANESIANTLFSNTPADTTAEAIIDNNQSAPFPDVPDSMTMPAPDVNSQPAPANTTPSGFKMFDAEEEAI